MIRRHLAAVLAGAIALAATVLPARADGQLGASELVAPAPPPGVQTMAIYGNLTNVGDAPVVLAGVEAAGFASAMLHQTVTTNDVVTMRHVATLEIAPGETVALAPGALHIMLMGPTAPVAPGEMVSGVFRLGDGSAVTFEAAVTGPKAMEMHERGKSMSHPVGGAS